MLGASVAQFTAMRTAVIGILSLGVAIIALWGATRPVPVDPVLSSSKAPYPAPDGPVAMPASLEGCKLQHLNLISRHGSRYLTKLKYIDEVRELLSAEGVRELFDQGNRAHVRHQAFFDSISGRDIVVSATHKKRTHQSRDAWLHGFRAAGATPDDSVFKVRDPPVATDISEEAMKLRFFSGCTKYTTYKAAKEWKSNLTKLFDDADVAEYGQRSSSTNHLAAFVAQLVAIDQQGTSSTPYYTALGWKPKDVISLVTSLYKVCQHQVSGEGRSDQTCSLFAALPPLHVRMEAWSDLQMYYKRGPATSLNTAMSCVLVQDFLMHAAQGRQGKGHPAAHLRFAHAETLLPFLALLNITGDGAFRLNVDAVQSTYEAVVDDLQALSPTDAVPAALSERLEALPWRGRELIPMGSNLQWGTYSCADGSDKVELLLNEVPAASPICGSDDGVCDMSATISYIHQQMRSLGVGMCASQTWQAMCANARPQ